MRAAAKPGEQRIEARPSAKFEEENSKAVCAREDAAKTASTADRDARLLGRARELARQVDALDKEMRDTGVDRLVYRQVAHATRALEVAGRMLTAPE
jgi:hypothetical protein